jgi:hypothetical protein
MGHRLNALMLQKEVPVNSSRNRQECQVWAIDLIVSLMRELHLDLLTFVETNASVNVSC